MRRRTKIALIRRARWAVFWLILPAAGLLALRLVWGWEADHRLAATRAELRGRGIRLDLPSQAVPDDQNATVALIEALNAIKLEPDDEKLISEGDGNSAFSEITWSDEHKADVRKIIERNAEAFHWANIAAQRPASHWPTTVAGLTQRGDHPIYHARRLANLLYDAALLAHEAKNDREALTDLRLIVKLSCIVDSDPCEISHLVACAIRSQPTLGVERLEPELHLDLSDGSLQAARELLSAMSDIRPLCEAHTLAWEVNIGTDELEWYREEFPTYASWWLRPALTELLARIMRDEAKDVEAVRADNRQTEKSLLPMRSFVPWDSNLDELSRNLPAAGLSEHYSAMHFRTLAASGAASMLLAARIFQTEHGRLPGAAQELVSETFPAIPVDPFSADHKPMRYRLDPAGPTVWSVSENGTDEGGTVILFDYASKRMRYGGSSNPANNDPDIIYGAAWRTATAPPRPAAPAALGIPGLAPVLPATIPSK